MDQKYDIIKPLEYYNNFLKDKFKQDTEEYFNRLFEKSGVDIEENKKLMDEHRKLSENRENENKKKKKYKIIRILLIIFIISHISLVYNNYKAKDYARMIFYLSTTIIAILVYFKVIKKKIKELDDLLENYNKHIKEVEDKGYINMAGLNNLFTSEMTTNLINHLIPLLNIDDNFDIRRFEQLVKNYNFLEHTDSNYSTLNLLSGDILGNPFVFIKYLIHEIINYTYSGSRTVSYRKTYRDSNGNLKTRTVTETLTGYVEKPGPNYYDQIFLIYGNEAAPNLTFSRGPTKKTKDGFFGKMFNSNKDKLEKLEKESVLNGGTFQSMTNQEFDMRFAAFDRDNEAEFRLLFTPLGQENMMEFLENDIYGDDLHFNKEKMINTIYCEHTDNWDINNDSKKYYDYDFEKCKENFLKYNVKYFEDMFFTFIPLLSIPLYQQHKSQEYIYGKSFNYNYNSYTTEMIANSMREENVKPDGAETRSILKTSSIKSDEDSDLVQIDAYSYRTERRVDTVYVRAGNGKSYAVNVPWLLYIPISKTSTMEVTNPNIDEDKYNTFKYNIKFNEEMGKIVKDYAYKNRLFGTLTNKEEIEFDDRIKEIFNN